MFHFQSEFGIKNLFSLLTYAKAQKYKNSEGLSNLNLIIYKFIHSTIFWSPKCEIYENWSCRIGNTVVFTPIYSYNWSNWYWCVCFFFLFLFRFLFLLSTLFQFFSCVCAFFLQSGMIWYDSVMVICWSVQQRGQPPKDEEPENNADTVPKRL